MRILNYNFGRNGLSIAWKNKYYHYHSFSFTRKQTAELLKKAGIIEDFSDDLEGNLLIYFYMDWHAEEKITWTQWENFIYSIQFTEDMAKEIAYQYEQSLSDKYKMGQN